VFEDYFAILAGLRETAHLVQMFDSTVIRARSLTLRGHRQQPNRQIKRMARPVASDDWVAT